MSMLADLYVRPRGWLRLHMLNPFRYVTHDMNPQREPSVSVMACLVRALLANELALGSQSIVVRLGGTLGQRGCSQEMHT